MPQAHGWHCTHPCHHLPVLMERPSFPRLVHLHHQAGPPSSPGWSTFLTWLLDKTQNNNPIIGNMTVCRREIAGVRGVPTESHGLGAQPRTGTQ